MKKCLLLTAVVFLGTFTAAIAQVPSYVPTDGLVGRWPFNGNANDESGNGNDGVVNGATLTIDRFGLNNAAYNFNSNTIDVGNSNSLSIGADGITVSAWVNENTGGNLWHILGIRNQCGDFHYQLSSNNFPFGLAWGGITSGLNSLINSGVLASPNQWNNLIGTFDGSKWRLYHNAVIIDSLISPVTDIVSTSLIFGNAGTCQYFQGKIDDIGIWNRALTAEEIQNLYIGCNVAPTTIAGNLAPATLTSTSYACNNNPGSTYQWIVTNGVITAGQGTSNVTVLWGEEGTGTLSVVETNAEGCSGATSTIDVTVVCATTATTIDGPLGPNALTSTTYTCNGVAGSSYQWTISNGVITSGQGTNSVNVLWAGTGLGTISVQETTNANCEGDVLSLDVVVIPTSVEEQQDLSIALFPNPASKEVTLTASEGLRGKIYTIFSSTGQAVMTGALSSRTVIDLQGLASGTYTVVVDGAVRKTLSVVQE